MIQRCDDARRNVADVGEVALVPAVVEDIDGLAGEDVGGEQEQRHVRSAPGSVDSEEAQTRGRQTDTARNSNAP